MNAKQNDTIPNPIELQRLREGLVAYLQQTRVLRSSQLTQAFLDVPREEFLVPELWVHAYEDTALPLPCGEALTQPTVLAHMMELLEVHEGMRVLEVGSGSGYTLALLSKLVGKKGNVFGVELDEKLVAISRKHLKRLKLKNVEVVLGDGALGIANEAPFDRVLVSAAVPFVPPALFKQLIEKGHIIAPVGDSFSQLLVKMAKFKGKIIKKEIEGNLYEFSPLKTKELRLKKME